MINLPNNLTKGQSLTFALNKELLIAAISDPYWSDSANIQKCIVVYRAKTGRGRQRKRLVFDFTQENPVVSIEWSEKARNLFELQGIVLVDFDGGSYTLANSELPLNKSISFASAGASLSEYQVFIVGAGAIVKTAENVYFTWGKNTNGQLGTGVASAQISTPTSVLFDVDYSVIESSETNGSGNEGTVALEKDTGDVYGWGRNIHGDIGVSNKTRQLTPTKANTSVVFSQISYGSGSNNSNSSSLYSLGIEKDTGKLYTWGSGDNYFGSLARSVTNYSTPLLATNASHLTFSKVYAGATAMSITTEGALYIWGGLVGNTPILVDNSRTYVDVMGTQPGRTGANKALFAMDDAGKIYAWMRSGCSNTSGILGNGTTSASTSLVEIQGGRTYSQMACGADHAAAIEAGTNKLYVWGNNSNGQLGDGTTTNRLSPTLIASDKQFSSVKCGGKFTIAVEKDTNHIYVWGNQADYRLGTGFNTGNVLTPTKITLPIEEASEENSEENQSPNPPLVSEVSYGYMPNGRVRDIISNGSSIYMGGDFSAIRPMATFHVELDKSSGSAVHAGNIQKFPQFLNSVNTNERIHSVAMDGDSTMYVVGAFNKITNTAGEYITRKGLAKFIKVNGEWVSDDAWNASGKQSPTSTPFGADDVVVDGDRLLLATAWWNGIQNPDGTSNTTYRRFFILDKNTGEVLGGAVSSSSSYQRVGKISVVGDWYYVMGTAFDNASSAWAIRRWNRTTLLEDTEYYSNSSTVAQNMPTIAYADITNIIEYGEHLYVVGGFTAVAGVNRRAIFRVNKDTWALDTTWFPEGSISDWGSGLERYYGELDGQGNIIIAGQFNSTLGKNIVKINLATGAKVSEFDAGNACFAPSGSIVKNLKIIDGSLYCFGNFNGTATSSESALNGGVVKLNLTTGATESSFNTSYAAQLSSEYATCAAVDGNSLHVFGNFKGWGGYLRAGVCKLTKNSNGIWQVDETFDPGVGGSGVYTMVLSGNDLYIGGNFTSWDGSYRYRLAKLNATTGAIDMDFARGTSTENSFNGVDGVVYKLAINEGYIYVGGVFNDYYTKLSVTSGSGTNNPAYRWLKINLTDRSIEAPTGPSRSGTLYVTDFQFTETDVYLSGNFGSWNGVTTQKYIVKLDKTTLEVDTNFVSSANLVGAMKLVNDKIFVISASSSTLFRTISAQTGATLLTYGTQTSLSQYNESNWLEDDTYVYLFSGSTGTRTIAKRFNKTTGEQDLSWNGGTGNGDQLGPSNLTFNNSDFAYDAAVLVGDEIIVSGDPAQKIQPSGLFPIQKALFSINKDTATQTDTI